MTRVSRNTARFTSTTVAPTGVPHRYEPVRPAQKHTTLKPAAQSTTPLKLRRRPMAVRAGKITRLEMSMAPIRRIPRTMVSAVSTDRMVL